MSRIAPPERRVPPDGKPSVPAQALILAGGKGTRLYPFTASMPKPLLPVWDVPVAEVMIRNLASQGVGQITLAVNHLADLITTFFGDGERFGVDVDHVRESQAMGTAGPLALLPRWQGDIVVTNGDILTDIDLAAMYRSHRSASAAVTVASVTREIRSNSGVLLADAEGRLLAIEEKPVRREQISIGIYILGEPVRRFLDASRPLEMPDLLNRCLSEGERICVYPHDGLWLDIGNPEDYARAQADEAIGDLVRGLTAS